MSDAKQPQPLWQMWILGLVFGVIFGFLLQKGGVAKYHILMGMLLLEDFTVAKVMLSAIVVGMAGVLAMNSWGLVPLHIKPTRYAANILGGLVFGIGFALSAYCPGTGAAALGQGNLDAIAMILGLLAGSYLFALASAPLSRTVGKWGDRGKLVLPDVLHVPRWGVVLALGSILLIAMAILERLDGR
jgi:uncharacterized protein